MKNSKIGYHAKVLFKGFLRTLFGAATAGAYALSIYGFTAIPTEDGYIAVCDFVGALAVLTIALAFTYLQGGRKVDRQKKGRFAA